MKKGIFIETENVQRFDAIMHQALDTERGRPGMVCVYSPAGLGKTLAAERHHAHNGGPTSACGRIGASRLFCRRFASN